MHNWMGIIISFAAGSVFGGLFAFLRFKSKLRFYRYFTEERLRETSLQVMRPHAPTSGTYTIERKVRAISS